MNARDDKPEHRLARPTAVRWLWRIFGLALGATVAAQFFLDGGRTAGAAGWPGLSAVLGFLACVALVLLGWALGGLVKRPEHYYRDLDR